MVGDLILLGVIVGGVMGVMYPVWRVRDED